MMAEKRLKYEQMKIDRMKNKKHERYYLVPTGDGFIIFDKLHDREGYDERGYSLRCGRFGEPVTSDKYKTADEFMELLNNLDLKVNGGLEDVDMVLFSKPKLYTLIESRLDHLLEQDLTFPEDFQVSLQTGNIENGFEIINVDCTVYKTSGLSPLLDNPDFMRFMNVINKRLDALEKEPDSNEKHIRIDELITIKTLLLSKADDEYKKQQLNAQLKGGLKPWQQ